VLLSITTTLCIAPTVMTSLLDIGTVSARSTSLHLVSIQEEENENMKSVREMVEWSYAKAEQNWPLLNRKDSFKVDEDAHRIWAEIRVMMYLLTNFKVCELEGSTMTGTRGFRCPPPTLAEYLAM
jgi:hypothetical protein